MSVARSLVDKPEEIKIVMVQETSSTLFQIRSCKTDVGKLIGTNGRTARALRVILAANAMRLKHDIKLDIDHGGRSAAFESDRAATPQNAM
jgi:predicted RNA-binding protein YlqC (UPF0109 family)